MHFGISNAPATAIPFTILDYTTLKKHRKFTMVNVDKVQFYKPRM